MLRRKCFIHLPHPDFCSDVGWSLLSVLWRRGPQPNWMPIEKGLSTSEIEEIRQLDYPNLTHEDEVMENINQAPCDIATEHSCATKKPTTMLGRQILARKSAKVAKVAEKDSRDGVNKGASATYSISSSISASQPKQIGVQIRAPPPMSFHPHHFVGGSSSVVGGNKGKEQESMKVFTEAGKKFVALTSLKASSQKKRGGVK